MSGEKESAESSEARAPEAGAGEPVAAPKRKASAARKSLFWAMMTWATLGAVFCLLRVSKDENVAFMAATPIFFAFCIFLPLSLIYGVCAIIGRILALVRKRPSPPLWPAWVGLAMIMALILAPLLASLYGLAEFYLKTGIRLPVQVYNNLQQTKDFHELIVEKLDARYRDAGAYYPWRPMSARKNQIRGLDALPPDIAKLPTFEYSDEQSAHSSDLNLHPAQYCDHFTLPMLKRAWLPYAYYAPTIHDASTSATGYIVWSCGPDRQYDLNAANIETAYRPGSKIPSDYLVQRIYDPTNGAFSRGDIVRYKGGDGTFAASTQ